MPDICKINALAIGRVSKVDGLANTSILDINGVNMRVSVNVPPLDTYTGAAAAYSVRLLRTAYTGAIMRVRRDSDNVEADVGFDSNNELSLTSPISNTSDAQSYTDFADFVDHTGTPANGFVRTWYDQASSNDAEQSSASSQPQIYNGTAVTRLNGKPCFSLAGKNLQTALNTVVTDANAFYCAGSISGGKYVLQATSNTGQYFAVAENGSTAASESSFTVSSYHVNGTQITTPNRDKLYDAILDQGIVAVDYNMTISRTYEFGYGSGFTNVNIQEVIIYHTDQSSNRTGIETNMDNYFLIC